jgi:hypothetical protein
VDAFAPAARLQATTASPGALTATCGWMKLSSTGVDSGTGGSNTPPGARREATTTSFPPVTNDFHTASAVPVALIATSAKRSPVGRF